MWLQNTGWQRKNHSSYWYYTSVSLWEFWCQKYYQKLQWRPETFNHQIGPSKTCNQFGFWTFCLVIPPGTQWNHEGSAAFHFLVVVLLPQGVPYYCITCTMLLAPEDRKEPSWKASTFNDKRCSMFSDLSLQERNILYLGRLAPLPICNSDQNGGIQRHCS